MTEAEWLACEDTKELLQAVAAPSRRKWRLLHVARCRELWPLLTDERSREMVATLERYADGLTSPTEMSAARSAAKLATAGLQCVAEEKFEEAGGQDHPFVKDAYLRSWAAGVTHMWIGGLVGGAGLVGSSDRGERSNDRTAIFAQNTLKDVFETRNHLIRDIFGNPFRPVAFAPEWRTDTALAIAAQMYDSRDFSAMPILADALQDAGCDRADMLDHCRDPHATHVRGCWVVDAVLGKA